MIEVAGPEARFYAGVVDRLVAWSVLAAACWTAYAVFLRHDRTWPGLLLVGAVVVVLWLGFGVALGVTGSSPGKAAAGLRALDIATGEPVGVGRALLRGLVLGLAGLPTVGIGLASLAWTALVDPRHQRRGWHDHLAHTVVVDVRPRPVEAAPVDDAPRHVVNLTALRLVPSPPPAAPLAAPLPARKGPPPREEQTGTVRRGPVLGPPTTGWVLTFDTGQRVPVDGLVLVGRRPAGRPGETVSHAVSLPSQDMSLSKTHAQLEVAADGVLVVTDRGSTNGSALVRQGVSRILPGGRPTTLLDGDLVHFGDRSMRVSREGAAPA